MASLLVLLPKDLSLMVSENNFYWSFLIPVREMSGNFFSIPMSGNPVISLAQVGSIITCVFEVLVHLLINIYLLLPL